METIAGDGFVLNQEVKEFEITPQEQTINFDIQSVQYKNERQRLQIEVQKKDKENEMPLYGAVFGLYVTEDIYTNIVYDAVSGKWIIRDVPVVTVSAGTFIKACVTGTDGKGIFAGELPLGKYEIKELTPPTGYLPTEETVLVDASYEGPHGGQFVQIQSCLLYTSKCHQRKMQQKWIMILQKRNQKSVNQLVKLMSQKLTCNIILQRGMWHRS